MDDASRTGSRDRPRSPTARRVDWPRAVLAGLAVATALVLLAAGATSSTAFGAYTPTWEGSSGLVERVDAAGDGDPLLREAAGYDRLPADRSLALVVAPASAYGADADRLGAFVRRGGTVVVAEDYGPHANPLLAEIGASARLDGRPVYDTRRYHRRTALPIAEPVGDHEVVAGVPSITLNRPTALRPGGATVVAETSAYAFVDVDGDGELDEAERLAPRPVATVERVGAGRVVVVADASVFINRMLERPGNRAFLDGLLARHDRVVLDVSHAGTLPPLRRLGFALRDSPGLQVGVGVAVLALVGALARAPAALRRRRGPRRPDVGLSEAAVASLVAGRHPEWDEDRIVRITTRLRRHRQGGSR